MSEGPDAVICDRVVFDRLQVARECDAQIGDAWNGLNRRSMTIGWFGYRMKKHDLFRELGFVDQHAYRKAKGVSRTVWYRVVGLAEQFANAPRELFIAMIIDNAELLAELPAEHRVDAELMQKAATESTEKFEDRLAEFQAERNKRPKSEQKALLKLSMNQGRKKAILEGLHEFMTEYKDIHTEDEALEMLIAEYRDRFHVFHFLGELKERLQTSVTAQTNPAALRAEIETMLADIEEALAITARDRKGPTAVPAKQSLVMVA